VIQEQSAAILRRSAIQECAPEQIRECHGESAEHPCEGKAEEME